jgi:hypothetical protein
MAAVIYEKEDKASLADDHGQITGDGVFFETDPAIAIRPRGEDIDS